MREFAKYNGDVQACLRALQREKLGGEAEGIDKTTRKRKWAEAQEAETKATEVESTKGVKAGTSVASSVAEVIDTYYIARMMNPTTPKKTPGPFNAPGTGQRPRLPTMKTPGTVCVFLTPYHLALTVSQARMIHKIPARATSPNPFRVGPPKSAAFGRTNVRPMSPSKVPSPTKAINATHGRTTRPPSAAHFEPAIPTSSLPRWPRKDERMLSVNGSPLANPLSLDLTGWLSRVAETESDVETENVPHSQKGLRRTNSIIVRPPSQNGPHSRANSQNSTVFPPQGAHSRLNSREGFVPTRSTQSQDSTHGVSAVVAVPTKDGHMLEFNPFQITPGEIDALDGISDAAKKQAKQDIARLVMQAVERWNIA